MSPMSTIADIRLTPEQSAAVEHLLAFPKDVQTLGGFGGTGKSVVVKAIKDALPSFTVCAPTGKAAHVLRRNGTQAATIHSTIYDCIEEQGGLTWECKLPDDVPGSGFVIDEGSMVSQRVHDDLLSFGRPVIFVGDHGQLEPVGDKFNLMASPDVTLETVHRNAGEIALFSQHIRQGHDAGDWRAPKGMKRQVKILTTDGLSRSRSLEHDVAICAYNATRVMLNQTAREHLGFPPGGPVVGDRVICLQNDRRLGVLNGMMGTIKQLFEWDEMLFCSGERNHRVPYVPEQFNQEKKPDYDPERIPFDYAYCLTCHKSQGDEWDSVLVLEQRCGAWEHARWAYTAASRAKKNLIWVKEQG